MNDPGLLRCKSGGVSGYFLGSIFCYRNLRIYQCKTRVNDTRAEVLEYLLEVV